jgi:hypothetical protein
MALNALKRFFKALIGLCNALIRLLKEALYLIVAFAS